MANTEYKRLVQKSGSGVPTIPPSASHDIGDWIETDIYEGEFYLDTDTGTLYSNVGGVIVTMTPAPATETQAGIAEIATDAETQAGVDDQRIVTPLKLKNWWTFVKTLASTFTGIITFTTGKIRIKVDGAAWYHAITTSATSIQTWNLPDEGDQTFASRNYTDNAIVSAVAGLLDYRGVYDASINAYPSAGGSGVAGAILKSDFWIISVAGTLPIGVVVNPGDIVIAKQDAPGNTQANWNIVEYNIGYVAENQANKSGAVVASATLYPNHDAIIAYAEALANKDPDQTLAANSDTLYPTQKAVKTYADTGLGLKEDILNKDVPDGYVGLSGLSIKFRNLLNTFTSLFENSNTASRTYTFPDESITVAGISDAITNGELIKAPTQNAVFDALAFKANLTELFSTIMLMKSGCFIGSAAAAGTYHQGAQQNGTVLTGVNSTMPPNMIYLDPANYPDRVGYTKKLRIKAIRGVNAVAPAVTFTVGLHPVTAAGGIVGGAAYNAGAVVAGSGVAFVNPGATSVSQTVGASFSFPAAGLYQVATVTSGLTAVSSGTHTIAELEVIYQPL